MKISNFSGGINRRKDASLLRPEESVTLINADISAEILKSAKGLQDRNTEVRGYFYRFGSTWVSSYLERSYVEYANKLYYTELNNRPQKFNGAVSKNLGIAAPATAPVTAESAATVTMLGVLDTSSFSTEAQSIQFSPDGFYMYALDATNDAVDMYELAVAWDVTTAAYFSKTFSVSAQEPVPKGLFFRPNGASMFIIGNNRYVYRYNLSTAWDVTTAVYDTSYNATSHATTPVSVVFSADGTRMSILDSSNGKLTVLLLTTPWLLSSITTNTSKLLTDEPAPTGFYFNQAGDRLYIVGTTNDKVFEYTLTTAWDMTTAVYYGILADIVVQTGNATDILFSPDMTNMYIVGETSASEINRYSVNRLSDSDGVFQHVYTFYNSIDGIESPPSPASDELIVKAIRAVTVSNIEVPVDTQVDKIRVYRVGTNSTDFALALEIDLVTSVLDNVPTLELTRILESENYQPAKLGAKYLVEAQGTFMYAIDNKVYFSLPGQPDYWPEAYSITFNKEVTGILPFSEGILVFSETRTDLLYGTSAADYTKKDLSKDLGCISHYSCKFIKGMPVWQSKEGFCTISGGNIDVFSKESLGTTTYDVVNSAVFDETYWACLTDGSLLAIDMRYRRLAFCNYEFPKFVHNIYADGSLYCVVDTDRLYEAFKGADLAFEYVSPVFIEDAYSEVKLYNNVYIRYNGTFELQILIDGILVVTHNLTGNTYKELTVPEDYQRGNSIQFIINGVGKVYEIEYKAQGRQNGR